MADLLRVWRIFHLIIFVLVTIRCLWTISSRRNLYRRPILTQIADWDDGLLFCRSFLHSVTTCSLLDVLILFTLLLLRTLAQSWIVDELTERLLLELRLHVLLITVKVSNTVSLLEQQLLRITAHAMLKRFLLIFYHSCNSILAFNLLIRNVTLLICFFILNCTTHLTKF